MRQGRLSITGLQDLQAAGDASRKRGAARKILRSAGNVKTGRPAMLGRQGKGFRLRHTTDR